MTDEYVGKLSYSFYMDYWAFHRLRLMILTSPFHLCVFIYTYLDVRECVDVIQ